MNSQEQEDFADRIADRVATEIKNRQSCPMGLTEGAVLFANWVDKYLGVACKTLVGAVVLGGLGWFVKSFIV